jgi:Flp pilus assembly protein TadD
LIGRARPALRLAVIGVAAVVLLGPVIADARILPKFGKARAAEVSANLDSVLPGIDQAIEEGRLTDAGRAVDTLMANGQTGPRVMLRSGELQLARARYEDAARAFTQAEADPAGKAAALQGRGIALAQMGRSEDALAALQAAVQADPTLWRAWNALGVEKDRRKDWLASELAYAEALKSPKATAIVDNNRGYSRLLQGRYPEASADFVRALEKDPSLAQARANLRLSLALRGDYGRATAVSGREERATVLNNAGFAAVMRGDLAQAEVLFQQAIDARGSSYGRAIENLRMVKAMQKSNPAKPVTP